MCTEVYNIFGHIMCQHKEYQNTFPCHIARRCRADDDQLLKEPIFLPAKPPNIPPGLLGCKVRKAIRPVTGKCQDCSRQQIQAAQSNGNGNNSMTPSSTSASATSVKSAGLVLAGIKKATIDASEYMTVAKKSRVLEQGLREACTRASLAMKMRCYGHA
ncbi:hypothetical protein F5Y12DRAFT_711019 [Xylaria sp. FL1777]|nr:hypothetical protein F5Y12DRAFT_711019 [Xylaria sp. FL1777]